MYQIDFGKPVHIYFCGIGGISMSGLASVLLKEGFTVTGSDMKQSPLTDLLISQGARISFPQKAENIPADADVMVYTAAIHHDNPEYVRAVEMGIPMLTRAQPAHVQQAAGAALAPRDQDAYRCEIIRGMLSR